MALWTSNNLKKALNVKLEKSFKIDESKGKPKSNLESIKLENILISLSVILNPCPARGCIV